MTGFERRRIVEVREVSLRCEMRRWIGRNALRGPHGDGHPLAVLALVADDGTLGWGHVGQKLTELPADADFGSLIGRRIVDLFDPERGVIDPAAVPVEIPLYDLVGNLLGMPVSALLGSHGTTAVRCYSGGAYFDDLDAPGEHPLDAVRHDLELDSADGCRSFKLKVGRGHTWMGAAEGLARDIDVTRMARQAYPDAELMVDANDGYSASDATRYLEAVSDCDLYWVEELMPESIESSRMLRADLDRLSPNTLLADGESAPDATLLGELSRSGLLDVALMDVVRFGITRWRAVMSELRRAGTLASPHTWGSPLSMYYASHLAAGLGNIPTLEWMPALVPGVDTSAYGWDDGMLTVTDAPGFGVRLVQ
ncbi:enolase C-terminal domain-like protein [Rathayibacter sp. CAU 1779]